MTCSQSRTECFLCRAEVEELGPSNGSSCKSALSIWADSCAQSLRTILALDESFQTQFESAVYCTSCLFVVRDLNFVLKAIGSLQERLARSKTQVESLLRTNYSIVLQTTEALDPLSDVKISPADHFTKAVGEALGFEVGTEQTNGGSVEFIVPDFVVPQVDCGPRRSCRNRPRKEVTKYRPILPKWQASEMEAEDSDLDDNDNGALEHDPDFVPDHAYDPDEGKRKTLAPRIRAPGEHSNNAIRLMALRMRQQRIISKQSRAGRSFKLKSGQVRCEMAEDCQYATRSHKRLEIHIRMEHEGDSRPFHCSCGKHFASHHYLKRHWTMDCPDRPPSVLRKKKALLDEAVSAERRRIPCGYAGCKFVTYVDSRHRLHLNTIHEEDLDTPYHCDGHECGKRFGSQKFLKRHQEMDCPARTAKVQRKGKPLLDEATAAARKKIRCETPDCRYVTYCESRLRVHRNAVHMEDPETPYHCDGPGCDKRFASHFYLKRHQRRECPALGKCAPIRRKPNVYLDEASVAARKRIRCYYAGCRYFTYSQSFFRIHRNSVHKEDPDTPYHCESPGCGKRFGSRHYLTAHLTRGLCRGIQAQGQAQPSGDDSNSTGAENSFNHTAPGPAAKPIQLAKRLKNEESFLNRVKLKCPLPDCKFITFLPIKLETHARIHQGDPLPFHCKTCDKKYNRLQALNRHNKSCPLPSNKAEPIKRRSTLGIPNPTKCEICSKTVVGNEEMQNHVELHRQRAAESVDKAFCCVVLQCEKVFRSSLMLKDHVRRDHEDSSLICRVCGLIVLNAFRLRCHMVIMHQPPDAALKCPEPECPYFGKSKSDLRNHSTKHTGNKNHQCAVCGNQFIWPNSLKVHMRVHDNFRPYKCSFPDCDKAFTMSDKLRTHEESHSTIRSYLCGLCPKSYKTKKHLDQHLRLTHKIREKLHAYHAPQNPS